MKLRTSAVALIAMYLGMAGLTGCSSIQRFGSRMDMVAGRMGRSEKPEYEGAVEAVKVYPTMTAIQFRNGPYFDCLEAPLGLVPGDVVRIYKIAGGHEARLWKAAPDRL